MRSVLCGPFGLLAWLLVAAHAPSAHAGIDLGARRSVDAAIEAYERGDFDAAVEGFDAAIAAGFDHPIVHYDLGNALFKRGEIGRAIASYSRAHRLAPRDERIRKNLQRARAQLRDAELASQAGLPPVLRPVTWLYGRASLDEWWTLASIAWALFVVARILGRWTTLPKSWLSRLATASIVVLLLAGTMGAVRYRNEVMREQAVVLAEEVEVRSGPGTGYNPAFRIHEGLTVQVTERREGWVRIDLGGDLVGWAPESDLETI